MEIFILIESYSRHVYVMDRPNKSTTVKVESVATEPVVALLDRRNRLQEKIEQAAVIDKILPKTVKPVKKPKARKPAVKKPVASTATPKPKRAKKPKA